ncbi:MAG: FAD-dependent oxidoreductase [Acidobacteria bacterium]|nr:FAD-dependent oxidoreductase [Acidobacteriota bacterium]
MASPVQVLCLGGGYCALGLSRRLRRAVRRGDVALTIVDANNFHTFHGLVAEMLAGKIAPGQIISAARRIFAPARFVNASVDTIDTAARRVDVSRSLDGRQYSLHYDHLVVAVGSVDDLSRYPGIAQHALKLKAYDGCLMARHQIIRMLELAEFETDPDERRRLLTFVIAGGNFGGVEVAGELAEYFPLLCRREFPLLQPDEIRIVIVHSGARLIPELQERHPRLVDYVEKQLARRPCIEVRRNARVAAATSSEIVLDSGEWIPSRTLISCTGSAPNPLLAQLPAARDERGRIITDTHLRVTEIPNVWSAGDCAAMPHPRGGVYPALFYYAYTGGLHIGRNILRSVAGAPPKRYTRAGLGEACAIGQRRAAGHLRGIELTGFPAWLLWRLLVLYYVPTWDRRVRTLLDWIVWPFVGRDMVSVDSEGRLMIRSVLYETGQAVVTQGDVGNTMYVIQSGEAEILVDGDEGPTCVGVLGPGDHFGEAAVFNNVRRTATVRARSRLQALELHRGDALSLKEAFATLGDVIGKAPVPKNPA